MGISTKLPTIWQLASAGRANERAREATKMEAVVFWDLLSEEHSFSPVFPMLVSSVHYKEIIRSSPDLRERDYTRT